jgi:hypothetical protein
VEVVVDTEFEGVTDWVAKVVTVGKVDALLDTLVEVVDDIEFEGVEETEGVVDRVFDIVGVIVKVGVVLGDALALAHIAPTQQFEPESEPPDAHSQAAQHPPLVQPPVSTFNCLPVGLLHTSQ